MGLMPLESPLVRKKATHTVHREQARHKMQQAQQASGLIAAGDDSALNVAARFFCVHR